MKIIALLLPLLTSGCVGSFSNVPLEIIHEHIEISQLEGQERCNKIHIDFRKECRAQLRKEEQETKQMTESMKKKHW